MTILFVTSCYVMWNTNAKLESLEDWVSDFINTIEKVQLEVKKVDYKGYFEADDEVGTTFSALKEEINRLDSLIEEQNNAT